MHITCTNVQSIKKNKELRFKEMKNNLGKVQPVTADCPETWDYDSDISDDEKFNGICDLERRKVDRLGSE